jgi:hypothetical protein
MDPTSAVAKAGQTPRDVGPRVLDGVGNLQVTAAAKMRPSATMSISFSHQRAETLVMRKDKGPMTPNWARLQDLAEGDRQLPACARGTAPRRRPCVFRENVSPEAVLDFLQPPELSLVAPRYLLRADSPRRRTGPGVRGGPRGLCQRR